MSPEEAVLDAELSEKVRRLLSWLTPREEAIIRRRFGIGTDKETLEVISHDLGITREGVRKIEVKALAKLKLHPGARLLLQDIDL